MTIELPEAEAPRRHYTGNQVFPIVAALMFGMSVALWAPVIIFSHDEASPEKLLFGSAILLAAFLAGELFPLQIEVRRETLLVSGSELPMVLGLLVMPAWSVGLTHVVAGALVFLIRRDSWRNVAVNLSFITVETGTAAFVMLLIMGENKADATTGLLYLAVAVGVLAGALMSAVAVGLTYRLLGPAEPLARVIGRSMLSAAAIVTFALVGYTVWNAGEENTYWGPSRLHRPGRSAGGALPHLLPLPAPARRPDPDVQLRPAGDERRLVHRRLAGRARAGPRSRSPERSGTNSTSQALRSASADITSGLGFRSVDALARPFVLARVSNGSSSTIFGSSSTPSGPIARVRNAPSVSPSFSRSTPTSALS